MIRNVRKITTVLAIVVLAALRGASAPDAPPSNTPLMVIGYLKILGPQVSIDLDNPGVAFSTGIHLPFFQENEDNFVAIIETESEGRRLCAFPLRTGDGRSAWIDKANQLIFAYTVESCGGRFYFSDGEMIPVVGETKNVYEIVIERFGRRVRSSLPKGTRNTQFATVVPQVAKVVRPAPAPVPTSATAPAHAPAPVPTHANGHATALASKPVSTTRVMTASAPKTPPPSIVVAPPLVTPPPPETAEPPPPAEETPPAASIDNRGIPVITVTLLLVVIVLGELYLNRRRKLRALEAASKGAAMPAGMTDDSGGKDFSGSIASVSLSSVAQFLNSNHESGTLDVKDATGTQSGTMVFVNGDIIDALSQDIRGVRAVYKLLQQTKGAFSFIRGETQNSQRTILESTIGLLLNANQFIDEESESLTSPSRLRTAKRKPSPASSTSAGQPPR